MTDKDHFDYNGCSARELKRLCGYAGVDRGRSRWVYWPPEVYSLGRHIRDYAGFPAWRPLHVYSDHGAGSYIDGIPPHELNSGAYCQFYTSPDNVRDFKKLSERPCFTIMAPFVHYRRKNHIEQSPEARGTLVFHSHSTPDCSAETELPRYMALLRELPEKFHPLAVMMHMHDVEKGVHEIYMQNGFPVYTAGNVFDQRFAERFYEVVRHFRYTAANSPGSYSYYSVEMGIPHFSLGDDPKWFNSGDCNMPGGEYRMNELPEYIRQRRLFGIMTDAVTPEQREYVEYHLGLHHGLSPEEMNRILWEACRKQGNIWADIWFQINVFRHLKNLARRILR